MSWYDPDKEDTTVYKVVVNHEEQYSIWPECKEIPLGWKDVGKVGLKPDCLAFIKEVWADMRPLSLRKKMEEMAKNPPAPQPPPDPNGPREKSLVDRLCEGDHLLVEAGPRPEKTVKLFKSDDQNRGALSFNLSHSNCMALYAVARGRRVGVDIEYMREDFATLEVAERFFSKDEVEALKAAPVDLRTEAFFNCWSRKEAYIKAIGMGVSYPLDGFTVSLGVAPALLKVDADATEVARWKMYGLDVAEGYAAALIVENPPVSLSRFNF
jgi:MbtH protein